MQLEKTFADFGIVIEPGQTRAFCPQCSPDRKKKYDKCLSVDTEKGCWFCHHCGWTGGLGRQTHDREEVKRYFTQPKFVECEVTDERVVAWFAKRGISKGTLNAFHIKSGLAWMHGPDGGGEVNTIQFPFYFNGKVVNIKYRTGDKRFRQEKNALKCLFNYDRAMQQGGDTLYIVEGEMDCLALYEIGITACVSVPDGAPSPDTKSYTTKFDFLKTCEPLFAKFKRFVLAGDDDAPGHRLVDELSNRLGKDRCLTVNWPHGCKDANETLLKSGPDVLLACIKTAQFMPVDGIRSIDDVWEPVMRLHETREQAGFDIGWENAKGIFNLEYGQMTIVTGIPSHGKSTFIDALRVNLWREFQIPSMAISPENWPVETHVRQIIEMLAGRNFYEMTADDLLYYMEQARKGFYFIMPEKDEDMMDVGTVLEKARTLIFREGIRILVIDPWNELAHYIPPGQREDQYISDQLAKIRRFARERGIHVFLIAHPRNLQKNAKGSYDVPTAYDIAGGAMWRNKADNILCVFRPDIKTNDVEVHVQKIRFQRNGRHGSVLKFRFNPFTSTYYAKKEDGEVIETSPPPAPPENGSYEF